MVVAIIWLSVMPSPPDPGFDQGDKLEHVLSYGALMFWFCQLHAAGRAQLALAAAFIALGVGLEFVQGALAYRTFEAADMLANTIGVIAGWAVARATGSQVFARIERLLGR
jgi:VanZ family protein